MNGHGLLIDIVVLLAAGVVFVPISQRLGLGSVLGYLAAGLAIGPSGLQFVTETESMTHVSEFGVVFLLFVIGLELEPKRLWQWRVPIFAMGSAQVAVVSLAVAGLALALGLPWQGALVLGIAASMSSTAVASQILRDRNLMRTGGGSSAFSILLFQDLAVIPVLAALPLIAGLESAQSGGTGMCSVWSRARTCGKSSRRCRSFSSSVSRRSCNPSDYRWRLARLWAAYCSRPPSIGTRSRPTSSRSKACSSDFSSCPSACR